MKRKLLACLLMGAMTISALSMIVSAEDTETEAVSETVEEGDTESAEISDDIYSFEVLIDGELYKFPMSYADFTAKGWTCTGDDTEELAPNYYSSETFKKGDLEAYVSLINFGINTVPLSEALVGGISIDEWQFEDAPETTIVLPGGITYGTATLDDITAAYGTPSDTYEGTSYTTLTYDYDSYQEVELYVDLETGVLNEVDIRNFAYEEVDNDAAAAEVSDEPTAEVLAYEAPTELGDDLQSFIVDFAGDLYQLPAPVSVFLENGWTLKAEDSEAVVAGKNSGWVYLMKDNQEFHTLAKNYSANATTIENCFITDVEVSVYGPNLPMTVQKGICLGMSEDDLMAALEGVDYEKTGDEPYVYYNIESDESSLDYVQVLLNTDEHAVTSLSSQYSPSSLD